jgi:hypothetical protein
MKAISLISVILLLQTAKAKLHPLPHEAKYIDNQKP